MVMHKKKTDMTVPVILVAVLLIGGGLVAYQMNRSAENRREVEAKREAVEKENERIRAANEAARKKKEEEDAKPDPSTIRFAPEGKPQPAPPPTTPEVPKGAEPPPP
jgi:outer membrane murein-binding lipoprotein Lpp